MDTGYTHRHQKTVGGICRIEFTPADNVLAADGTLREPSLVWPCIFAEGAARYREETTIAGGIPTVAHTIEFHTDKIDRDSDNLIRSLAALSLRGLAAVVTTQNHARLLVGWSEAHGPERPLRLEQAVADTGKNHTDAAHEAVRLICRDTVRATVLD